MDPTSFTTFASPAPRYASTWESSPSWPSGGYAMASDISNRRVSEATNFPAPDYFSGVGNITPRNASVWDATMSGARASTWDSRPWWHRGNAMASDITNRRVSEATNIPVPEYNSGTGNIARRKASARDTTVGMSDTRACGTHTTSEWKAKSKSDIATMTMSSVQASAAPIITALLHPKCDRFSEVLPEHRVFTLRWTSIDVDMATSPTYLAVLNENTSASDNNRATFAGNIDYIFELHDGKDNLAMADIEAILYVYGVDNTSAQDILKKTQPRKRGLFNMNTHNEQILLAPTIKFSPMKEPLCILRLASNCYQKNLLSPLHFARYIINVLTKRYVGFVPRFMILGMYSILGVLEGSTDRKLTTKDVETFVRLWKVANIDQAQNLINMINNDHCGTISCYKFYTLLYRQNMFGKQLIEMFHTQGQQNPSMFFYLIDKDDDGFLSYADLRGFATIFGRVPTDGAIDRATRKLDMDGDGKISLEDFREAMVLVLDGMTWEFWLVAILFTLDL